VRFLHGIAKDLGAELNYSAKVVEVDMDNKRVTLEDGRVFEGDLIVGADGLDGISRPIFEAEPPVPFVKLYR
jgi:salicylate hydroxylase